jgi:NAD(P)-dependent dehydrogenase (short-subunit alcohol dehydrogenase family)
MAQVWLITGSSRGVGRKTAEAVLAAGHRLSQHGDRVRSVALDARDAEQAARFTSSADSTSS